MEEIRTNIQKDSASPAHEDNLAEIIRDLQARNQTLHDQVDLFRAIFANIPEGLIVIRSDGGVLFNNPAAQKLLAAEPGHVPIENWSETYGFYLDDEITHFPGKNLPPLRAFQGELNPIDEMVLRPPGVQNYTWIQLSAYPLLDQDGGIDTVIVLIRDISTYKKMELSRHRHARRAEMLYAISRSLAEIGDDLPQALHTIATHIADFIGDACVISLLNDHKDMLKIAAIQHPNAKARSMLREALVSQEHKLEDGIAGGVIASGEPLLIPSLTVDQMVAVTRPEFSKFIRDIGITSILIVPIKGQQGVLGTIGVSRDRYAKPYTPEDQSIISEIAHRTSLAIEHNALINSLRQEVTERQGAERALIDSEVRFRSMFETTSLGVKILSLDGVIVQINSAFQDFIGHPAEQIIGKHFIEFLHPGDQSKLKYFFEKLAAGETQGFRLEHRLIHLDGSTVWVNASFAAVRHNAGSDTPNFVFGIVENITQRKLLEFEMREMKTRLQENIERERLRLAQDLHDGPMQDLYSAVFQLESLRRRTQDFSDDTLDDLRQGIQKVIDDLRNTAQELRPPTLADFGLEQAIRSHAENLSEKYPQLKFSLSLARDQQMLPENIRLALFRIYQTSVANILRHAGASEVYVRFTYDIETTRLEIRDNGTGFEVPEGWIEFTRKDHYGLAGAAERAESLGGSLIVESSPGRGTLVRAEIPCLVHE